MAPETPRRLALAAACEKHRLALVYLFGSMAAQGVAFLDGAEVRPCDPLADLDVGVVTAFRLPGGADRADLYAAVYDDFTDIFRPFKVDLSFLEEGHSVFQAQALTGTCVYAVTERAREEYEMLVLRRAADFAPVLRQFHREILEEL